MSPILSRVDYGTPRQNWLQNKLFDVTNSHPLPGSIDDPLQVLQQEGGVLAIRLRFYLDQEILSVM